MLIIFDHIIATTVASDTTTTAMAVLAHMGTMMITTGSVTMTRYDNSIAIAHYQ